MRAGAAASGRYRHHPAGTTPTAGQRWTHIRGVTLVVVVRSSAHSPSRAFTTLLSCSVLVALRLPRALALGVQKERGTPIALLSPDGPVELKLSKLLDNNVSQLSRNAAASAERVEGEEEEEIKGGI